MKQNILLTDPVNDKKCSKPSCGRCQNCKVEAFEEDRFGIKNDASQLYAKEAENYFFYYELHMKQSD